MKMKNKFLCKTASLFLIAAGLVFASCSNGLLGSDDANQSGGSIRISLGLKSEDGSDYDSVSSARTVVAHEKDRNLKTLADITLYGKLSSSSATLGSEGTKLAVWENYDAMSLSPYSKSMAAGNYDFMLSAKNYGATMTQTLPSKTISAGSTTELSFTSLAASPKGNQTGAIDITLDYPSYGGYRDSSFSKYVDSYPAPYPVISISLDSKIIVTKDSTKSSISETTDENGNTYKINSSYATQFISAPVSAGFHVVSFTFTATDGSVLVYPVPVFVQAGYLSKSTLHPFMKTDVVKDSSAASFTITYKSNTTEESAAEQTFYEGSSIADAEALGFSSGNSKRFKSWNTKKDGSGTSYKAGDTPVISGNLTLYAQWGSFKKLTYSINIDKKNDIYVQQYENSSSILSPDEAFPDFDFSSYIFCGWDTTDDGSGTRYDKNKSPSFTNDTVLYAQWGKKATTSGYDYEVSSAKDWNAVMGSPSVNSTSGKITANVYVKCPLDQTISNPNTELTKDKEFNGKLGGLWAQTTISGFSVPLFKSIAADSEVKNISLYGVLCKDNHGTIKSVGVKNFTVTGSYSDDSIGAVCYKNYGTIDSCSVDSVTVDGSSNYKSYTGGICGYNEGSILGSTTVNVVVKGYSGGDWGYVSGYNEINCVNENSTKNPVSTTITVSGLDATELVNKSNETLSNGSTRTYTFTVDKTSKVHFVLKDSSGGSKTNRESLNLYDSDDKLLRTFVSSGTPNVDLSLYLNKGTYKLKRSNGNAVYTSYMNINVESY